MAAARTMMATASGKAACASASTASAAERPSVTIPPKMRASTHITVMFAMSAIHLNRTLATM